MRELLATLCCLLVTVICIGCPSMPLRLPQDEEINLDREIKAILKSSEQKNPVALESIVSELGFISPLDGKVLENRGEEGVSFKATEGQSVRAVKSGLVTFVSDDMTGFGKVVTIKHSDGFLSFYAYNSEILVKIDQVVKQGEVIAKAGKSGRATQPQLYFRLFKGETPVNPMRYLP
ncbi:MAG TPA: M23 family metallopeptidase [Planctomycetota bacterium]|nr:M23 family metallopeptidase [Planctomycetota bacterium]